MFIQCARRINISIQTLVVLNSPILNQIVKSIKISGAVAEESIAVDPSSRANCIVLQWPLVGFRFITTLKFNRHFRKIMEEEEELGW